MSDSTNNGTIKQRILNSPDKLIGECKNGLAALWRTILRDLDINEEKWNSLMNIYLTDPINGFDDETKSLGDKRGNLTKALCYDRMQMLIFNRALRFLQTQRATLIFTLYPENEKDFPISTYSINVLYGKNESIQKIDSLNEDKIARRPTKRRFVNTYQKHTVDISAKKYTGDYSLDEWLNDPDKMSSSATGPLSKLWRRIISDRGINKPMWKTLTTKYQRKVAPDCDIVNGKESKAQLKALSKQRSNIKGNVTDELQRPAFTIDVFMKGMVFLEVKEIDITIRLKRANHDRLTTHSVYRWKPINDLDKIMRKYKKNK